MAESRVNVRRRLLTNGIALGLYLSVSRWHRRRKPRANANSFRSVFLKTNSKPQCLVMNSNTTIDSCSVEGAPARG